MRTHLQGMSGALLALLVAACADIPDPRPQADLPPDNGDAMQPPEPDGDGDDDPPSDDPPLPPPVRLACRVDGQTFPDGSAVPSADGCNSCGCDNGRVLCTEIACDTPPEPEPLVCDAAGQPFQEGADVPSGDSCNTCRCEGGVVACTEIACDPVFCAEFIEEPDGACSRFPLDPCRAQDPDCTEASEPSEP